MTVARGELTKIDLEILARGGASGDQVLTHIDQQILLTRRQRAQVDAEEAYFDNARSLRDHRGNVDPVLLAQHTAIQQARAAAEDAETRIGLERARIERELALREAEMKARRQLEAEELKIRKAEVMLEMVAVVEQRGGDVQGMLTALAGYLTGDAAVVERMEQLALESVDRAPAITSLDDLEKPTKKRTL